MPKLYLTPELLDTVKYRKAKTQRECFWDRVAVGDADDCWEWQGFRGTCGYGQTSIGGANCSCHRVAWVSSFGPIPDELCVLHKCDNPPCCNPAHLFLGTQKDNKRDEIEKGRNPSGDRHWTRRKPEKVARGDRNGARTHPERLPLQHGTHNPRALLDDDVVREIRRMRKEGIGIKAIAERFGIGMSTASMIATGKRWRHVI